MNGRGPGHAPRVLRAEESCRVLPVGAGPYFRGELWPLVHGESRNQGIKARNKEQRFALELLLNDQIRVATLVGRAGTGKTLLAIAVGLEKVMEQKIYTRLLITRPVIPMGNDLGFLPGFQGGEAAALDAAHL